MKEKAIMLKDNKTLKIGSLEARMPVVQGGMGIGISLSGLASAVAEAGGVGVISAAGVALGEKDFKTDFLAANIRALKKEIAKARSATKGIIGINIMVALSNFSDLVKAALDEKVDIIFAGAGLPLNLPSYLDREKHRTKLVPIISSARAAALITKAWKNKYDYMPDAFVVEGPLAGGHLGFSEEQLADPQVTLEKLVSETLVELDKIEEQHGLKIPLIAGGGVYSGADMYRMLELGASGVQMGTRFVVTDECDASNAFKQTYLDAKEEDIGLIVSPVGLPGRAIINSFIEEVKAGKAQPTQCPYDCITTCKKLEGPYCISNALIAAKTGRLNRGYAFAGANAYRCDRIMPVAELMQELADEYNELVER